MLFLKNIHDIIINGKFFRKIFIFLGVLENLVLGLLLLLLFKNYFLFRINKKKQYFADHTTVLIQNEYYVQN